MGLSIVSAMIQAIGLSGGSPPPLPDLTFAEPQVRAALSDDIALLGRDPDDTEAWRRYAGRLAVHEYLLEAVAAWERAQQLDFKQRRPYRAR